MAKLSHFHPPDPAAPPGAADDPLPARGKTAACITARLLRQADALASDCGAAAIFLYADALVRAGIQFPSRLSVPLFLVTRAGVEESLPVTPGATVLRVPNVPLSRLGQLKIATFLALGRGLVTEEDVIVCLGGMTGGDSLDTIIVTQIGRELIMPAVPPSDSPLPDAVLPEVIERVIDIAAELGSEGREGLPVGTMFVLGDSERVLNLSRQLILNPFLGYPAEHRNLLDPMLEETVKELSILDGAFLVRGDGVVEACGTFLTAACPDESGLPGGLGARHHAAAAITSCTAALAVTVSQSTGTVTIFRQGRVVTELEKPRSPLHARRQFG